ncbi:NAD(P)-dependent oxidoreductase [Leuconostoc carnosum]|uniref:NAD(P)-dependent oxidoreductase n=1 Tax=Leuconostoc carnosum TaxID=1252 RepID=UPI00160DD03C|nr:NAD(P)-dependent oxidoreductase [Leuconostoc carnosum]MBB6433436.1 D-lactate dehydrogenase [Leuconostoc carnosum]
MKILFYNVADIEKSFINDWAKNNNITVKTLSVAIDSNNIELTRDYDAVVFYPGEAFLTDKKLYAQLAQNGMRQISVKSTGYDNINFTFAEKYQLSITNVPNYSPESVAHFTVMSIIMLLRHMPIYLHKQATTHRKDFIGQELTDLTIGIYGAGRLGSLVAKTLKYMGARVLINSRTSKPELEQLGIESVDFKTLLTVSDVISIHVPLNEQTHHLFDFDNLDLMKQEAMLVNTARGSIIDTKALIKHLQQGKFKGVALDALEDEEFFEVTDNPYYQALMAFDNVLITPHIAYFTQAAVRDIAITALDNARDIVTNGESENIVLN